MATPLRLRLFATMAEKALDGLANKSPDEIAKLRVDPIEAAPKALRGAMRKIFGAPQPGVVTSTITVPGADGPLPARLHRPNGVGDDAPVVLHLHGGGFVLGNPAGYDWFTSLLAVELGAVVVSVDYRMAPEHPAPAAPDDARAVCRWLLEGSGREALGASGPVLVAGDSAGGNLAALAAIDARDRGQELAAQLLIYPVTDLTGSFPSASDPALDDAMVLPLSARETFIGFYLGDRDGSDPGVSPHFVSDLSGLPPAVVITAELDPLCDEGIDYARRLGDAGVDVRHTTYVGMPHGFMAAPTLSPLVAQATAELVTFARLALAERS